MVAEKETVVPKDEKSELDLGIEESIRRCEALLSMVPISLQPILADGALRRSLSKQDVVEEPQTFKNKMSALEPEWTKNMGLLSGISDQILNTSTVDEFEVPCCDISLSSEELSEKSQPRASRIPKPPQSRNSSSASLHVDCVPMQDGVRGAKEEFFKRIHVKRQCSRSSEGSSTASASEDWTLEFTHATEATSTSVSGTQDDNSVEETKGVGEKESTRSGESEKQSSSETGVSFIMEKKNEEPFSTICGQLQVDDLIPMRTVPSRTPTNSSTEKSEVEELEVRKTGNITNSDTSKTTSSCRSFEALCFSVPAPKHCQDAWEWLGRPSAENVSSSDHNYEGNVIHESLPPPREKKVRHFIQTRLKTEKPLDRVSPAVESAEKAAKLKPRGITTNLRRTKSEPAVEKPISNYH